MGADGSDPAGEPAELTEARLIIGLYDRWGYHPGLLDDDAELLRHLKICDLAGLNETSGGEYGGE